MGSWWTDYKNNVLEGFTLEPDSYVGAGPHNGVAIDLTNAQEGHFALMAIGLVTGTNPTLDVTLEESDDGSIWTAITDFITGQPVAFSQKTDADVDTMDVLNFKRSKKFVRAVAVETGTTPVFGITLTLHGMRRRVA